MTDKVQKIRKEVERLQDLTMDKNKNFYSEAAEGEYNALCNIEHFIDSLQEEPKPLFNVGDVIRNKQWKTAAHKIVSMDDKAYYLENGGKVEIAHQELWEVTGEQANNDLEEAAVDWHNSVKYKSDLSGTPISAFKAGAEWQKEHLWKDTQGDDLPEIDREVIALLNNGKVVFAHRPYKGKYLGKNLTTGNIETFENKVYDKGGWNQPDVKYWLDCYLPKEMEE